jgi:hypothetical protein
LTAHGIVAQLPPGWEGAITVERDDHLAAQLSPGDQAAERVFPVAHFATFALPAQRGDFGSLAVEAMGPDDAFVSLLEYEPAEASSALFSHHGLPRQLDPRAFSPRQLQRTLRGQAGFQLFFNEAGRAFCLYVVLGNADDAHRLVRRVEQVLATIAILERP